jgi:cytochrome b
MTDRNATEIIVWDPLVRLFHWTLVIAFTLAYFSQEGPFEDLLERMDENWVQNVHVWAGYTIAGLLLFRLVWGFAGPRHARFGDFVRGPRETLRYV